MAENPYHTQTAKRERSEGSSFRIIPKMFQTHGKLITDAIRGTAAAGKRTT